MRALCGAIITAGAMLGLGLTAVGIGIRFQSARFNDDLAQGHVGPWLGYIVVFLTILTIIGVVIAFMGLAYHHERRHREHLRDMHLHGGTAGTPVTPR